MNYSELQTAVLGDSHRENYTAHVGRFIEQGEALIRTRLKSYGLEYNFTDADRIAVGSPVYTLPARLSFVRHVLRSDGMPLDQVDENIVSQYKTAGQICAFAIRPTTMIVAATPGLTDTLQMSYMGMPLPLSDVNNTNQLLTDYPQLYIEATQVYVFKRARDFEASQVAFQSVNSMIDEINQKVKKQLGGARAANSYNTDFRSSY